VRNAPARDVPGPSARLFAETYQVAAEADETINREINKIYFFINSPYPFLLKYHK
jgi:hypothetical protein